MNETSFYKGYPPSTSLATLIREIQIHHAPSPLITCHANTEHNLTFYLGDSVVPPVVVTGPKYRTVGQHIGSKHLTVKVAFHPTGMYRLLGTSMEQTVNAEVVATYLFGLGVLETLDRLRRLAETDDCTMIAIVTTFLEKQKANYCRPEEPLDRVSINMRNPLDLRPTAEWAAEACLSFRQFQRNFITRVGLSPKLFRRIVRFEGAMKIKNSTQKIPWAEIAAQSGYTDSSHLLREFREFAAFSRQEMSHSYYHPLAK